MSNGINITNHHKSSQIIQLPTDFLCGKGLVSAMGFTHPSIPSIPSRWSLSTTCFDVGCLLGHGSGTVSQVMNQVPTHIHRDNQGYHPQTCFFQKINTCHIISYLYLMKALSLELEISDRSHPATVRFLKSQLDWIQAVVWCGEFRSSHQDAGLSVGVFILHHQVPMGSQFIQHHQIWIRSSCLVLYNPTAVHRNSRQIRLGLSALNHETLTTCWGRCGADLVMEARSRWSPGVTVKQHQSPLAAHFRVYVYFSPFLVVRITTASRFLCSQHRHIHVCFLQYSLVLCITM